MTRTNNEKDMIMPAVAQQAFERFDTEYIRTQEWTDVDLFALIGNFAVVAPDIAHALSFHARDILADSSEDIDYTDLVSQVYMRTFFEPANAAKYGTGHYAGEDGERLPHFVDYMITMLRVSESGSANVVPFAPPQAQ